MPCYEYEDRDYYVEEIFFLADCTDKEEKVDVQWGDGTNNTYSTGFGDTWQHTYYTPGEKNIILSYEKDFNDSFDEQFMITIYGWAQPFIGEWTVSEEITNFRCGSVDTSYTRSYDVTISGDIYGQLFTIEDFGNGFISELGLKANSPRRIDGGVVTSLTGSDGGSYSVYPNSNVTYNDNRTEDDLFYLNTRVEGALNGNTCGYNSAMTFTRK